MTNILGKEKNVLSLSIFRCKQIYNNVESVDFTHLRRLGVDPGFSFGGHKKLCARTHIISVKPEVPYGRGPGPT